MLCLLLSSPSLAFAPTPLQGVEPVRLRTTTAEGQATFRQTRLWREFVEGEGRGWQARVDERTGTPHRMWGGLPLVSRDADALEVEAALRAFTARHTELLGAPADLPMRALESVDDAWYADFQAMRDGVPIWRSALTFRIRAGSLALVGADTYPTTPTRGAWALDEDVARWFRGLGAGYHGRINAVLRTYMLALISKEVLSRGDRNRHGEEIWGKAAPKRKEE